MLPVAFLLRQRVLRQRLERIPEPSLVMTSSKQDREYNEAALRSGLAISYELILDSILRRSPLSGRALDIGCGSGQLLLRVARHMPDVRFLGIDLSDAMLGLAERSREAMGIDNVRFAKHDMLAIDELEIRDFDLVTANNVLHHCEDEDGALRILDSIASVVADRGTVFVFDLCRMKTEELLITLLDYTAKDLGDYFYNDTYDSYGAAFSYPELAAILARSRLRNATHLKPLIGNVVQIIYRSHTRNRGVPRTSYLTSWQQRLDWLVLRTMFLGRL